MLGTGFVANSVVRWNGVDLPTTYVSAIELRAAVPGAFIANVSVNAINVANPVPGGIPSVSDTAFFAVTAPTPANITAAVTIERGGFRRVRSTGRYVQRVTITNTSQAAFNGPVYLVLDNLGTNVSLFNKSGSITYYVPIGSPYTRTDLSTVGNDDAVLDSGETVTFDLEFANPTDAAITYTARVLAGPSTP